MSQRLGHVRRGAPPPVHLSRYLLLVSLLLTASAPGLAQAPDGWATQTTPTAAALPPEIGVVLHVAVSPGYASDRTLYATAALDASSYDQVSLYRSTDGGVSWQLVRTGAYRVYLPPTFPQDRTLFVFGSGVWRSPDDGAIWTKVFDGGMILGQNDLVFSPEYATDGVAYLALTHGNNLLVSTDEGRSFQQYPAAATGHLRDRPVTPYMVHTAAFSPAYASDATIFLGYYQEGVARSSAPNAPFVWAREGLEGASVVQIAISPAFDRDRTLLALARGDVHTNAMDGLYRSTTAGDTWSRLATFATPPTAILYRADAAYALHEGRVLRSRDGGLTWVERARIEGAAHSSALTASPSGREVFVGSNHGIAVSRDGGDTWVQPALAASTVVPDGGGLAAFGETLTVTVSSGAFAGPVEVSYSPYQGEPGGHYGGQRVFSLAFTDAGAAALRAHAQHPLTVDVKYDDAGLTDEQEASLRLLRWDGSRWLDGGVPTEVDTEANLLTASLSEGGVYGVLGGYSVMLPAVVR